MRKSQARKPSTSVTEEDCKAALDILRRDYYQDVRGIGDELKDQVKSREITDRDTFETYLHQAVDGSARVIYTLQAQIGLLCSDNEDAYLERFGDLPVEAGTINWSAMMFEALEQDVLAYIGDDISFDD